MHAKKGEILMFRTLQALHGYCLLVQANGNGSLAAALAAEPAP